MDYKQIATDVVYSTAQSWAMDKVLPDQGLKNPYVNRHLANGLIYAGVKASPLGGYSGFAGEYAPEVAQLWGFAIADTLLNGINLKRSLMAGASNAIACMVQNKAMGFLYGNRPDVPAN